MNGYLNAGKADAMMKKALSVILLFVLVFNMVVAGVEVKAEDNGGTSQETDNYIQLSTGVATKIDITTAGQEVYCEFVPEQSGTYKFDAESEGEYTCAWLYDSDFQDIAEGDYPDGEYGEFIDDFEIIADLNAGETYYLKTCFGYDYSVGTYDVTPILLQKATSMEIVNGETITCYLGKVIYLKVKFNPVGESINEDVTWSSSNENVATVSEYGWVNGVGVGTATITAESTSGFVQSIEVIVRDVIPEILVGEEKNITSAQKGEYIYYKFTPDKTGTYVFSSNGNENAIITLVENSLGGDYAWQSGHLYYEHQMDDFTIIADFVKGETYYLRIEFAETLRTGFSVSVEEVTQKATSVEIIAKDELVGRVGAAIGLYHTLQPTICIPESITWSVDDKSIVSTSTVDEVEVSRIKCHVKCVAPGKTTLMITTENGLTDSVDIVVKDEKVIPCEVGMDYTYLMLETEEYFEFVPEKDGVYKFSAYNTAYDSKISVLDKDYNSLTTSENEVSYQLTAGETYYFKLQKKSGGIGQFDLNLVVSSETGESPSTDGCIELSTEEYAIIDVTEQDNEKWCEFIPEESGIYKFTTNSGGYDTKGYLYDSNYTELTSHDDTVPEIDLDFTILYELQAGETYYLAVHYLGDEENQLWLKPREITDITDMSVGADVYVEIKMLTEGYEEKVLRFVPEESGTYFFESELVEGYSFICGEVYEAEFHSISCSEGGQGFGLSVNLVAGNTYYLHTSVEDRTSNWESNYRVRVSKTEDVVRGDLDGNGTVNRDDAIYLLYHTMLPEKYSVNQDVDFDGNGYVTSDDAIYLLNNPVLPEKDNNESGDNTEGDTGSENDGGNPGGGSTGDGSSVGNDDEGEFGAFF